MPTEINVPVISLEVRSTPPSPPLIRCLGCPLQWPSRHLAILWPLEPTPASNVQPSSLTYQCAQLQGLHDPLTRPRLAASLASAARSSGFFQITDHPLPPSLLSRAFATSAALFALPLERKQALARDPHTNRGWDSFGGQDLGGAIGVGHEGVDKTTAAEKAEGGRAGGADTKEGWMVGPGGVGEGWEYWGRFGHGRNVLPGEGEVEGAGEVLEE